MSFLFTPCFYANYHIQGKHKKTQNVHQDPTFIILILPHIPEGTAEHKMLQGATSRIKLSWKTKSKLYPIVKIYSFI